MATCKRCNGDGVFVDHGPTVGKGWYCRNCKDDIDHWQNEFGNIASDKRFARYYDAPPEQRPLIKTQTGFVPTPVRYGTVDQQKAEDAMVAAIFAINNHLKDKTWD